MYRKLAAPALTAAGGRYLVRNKPAKTYEAGINEHVILIELDSLRKPSLHAALPPIRRLWMWWIPEMSNVTYFWWKANDRCENFARAWVNSLAPFDVCFWHLDGVIGRRCCGKVGCCASG